MQIWKWMIDVGITSVLFYFFLMYFPVSAGYLNESSGWPQPMSSTILFITRIVLHPPLIGALLASWYWRAGVRGPLIYLEKLDFVFSTLNYSAAALFTCSHFCSPMVSWLLKEHIGVVFMTDRGYPAWHCIYVVNNRGRWRCLPIVLVWAKWLGLIPINVKFQEALGRVHCSSGRPLGTLGSSRK